MNNGNKFLDKIIKHKCSLLSFLSQIEEIEKDKISNPEDKLIKIRAIRQEINKVGIEIDKVKKEITLLGGRFLN